MTGGGEAGFVRFTELLLATAAMLEIELRDRRVRAPTAPAVTTCCFFSTARRGSQKTATVSKEEAPAAMVIFPAISPAAGRRGGAGLRISSSSMLKFSRFLVRYRYKRQ